MRRAANGAMAEREFAQRLGEDLASRMDLRAVQSAATSSKLGDFFQYLIDHPVSLARQKSALLPIIGKDIDGTRVLRVRSDRPAAERSVR